MDSMCLKTGISAIAPSISISGSLDARANPSQVSAVGQNTAEKSPQKSVFSRFSSKMDFVCLKTSISAIAPSISISGSLDARANLSQVSAVGWNTVEKSPQKSVFSRFSFKYPLKSLWPGGSGNSRYNGLALDDAVLVESSKGKAVQEDGGGLAMDPVGQNGSWVFKILQVKSVWKGELGKANNVEDSRNEEKVMTNDQSNKSNDDDEKCVEEVCDACGVEDDDEEEVHVYYSVNATRDRPIPPQCTVSQQGKR